MRTHDENLNEIIDEWFSTDVGTRQDKHLQTMAEFRIYQMIKDEDLGYLDCVALDWCVNKRYENQPWVNFWMECAWIGVKNTFDELAAYSLT